MDKNFIQMDSTGINTEMNTALYATKGTLYSELLRERMHHRKLSNGIDCYIIPKEDFREKTAAISIGYGAADVKYNKDGLAIQTPEGIAHFLEHRMFGDDYFERFSKLGASVNAYTGLGYTAYHFTTTDNFNECLSMLIEMVNNPHISEESVSKEKDVIAREICMYTDDPRWAAYLNMMESMFHVYPVKGNIAGTVDSINLITPEMLYECHKVFYTTENMSLVCSGNIDPTSVYGIAERIMPIKSKISGTSNFNITRDYGQEPPGAANNRIRAEMPLAGTVFDLGFKDSLSKNSDIAKKISVTGIILDYIFGESSNFYEKLYKSDMIDRPFEPEYICGGFFGVAVVSSTSKSSGMPEAVAEEVYNELDRIKAGGFDKSRFDRIVKKQIGRMTRSFNNISGIALSQADISNVDINLFDLADRFAAANPDEFMEQLNGMFTRGNAVLSTVEPIS